MSREIDRRFLLIGLGLALLSLSLGGCQKEKANDEEGRVSVKIALVTPLEGEVQDLGKEMLNAAQMAIDQMNQRQKKFRFVLLPRNSKASAATAALEARGAVENDEVIAVIAGGTSASAKGIIESLRHANVAVISSAATRSDLAELGRGRFFRVIPPNRAQAEALAHFAHKKLQARSAAVLVQQDDYAVDLKTAFEKAFTKAGGRIASEVAVESDETDFRAQLQRLAKTQPDVVLIAAQHVPLARSLVRARELGINLPVLSGETAFTEKLLKTAGAAAGRFYLTGPSVDLADPSERLGSFMETYKKRYGTAPGPYAAYTYDAVSLLAHLASERNATTGPAMIRALRSVDGFVGVTGPITFDARGDVSTTYRIYMVSKGQFVPADR